MGTVVAATNVVNGQRVALKFLLPELSHDAAIVERLVREARASARLRSEHVCRIYDVAVDAGTPCIVMELLDGADLASMVSQEVLPISIAADYVLQAITGLAEAHTLGIVHRDLKPANLFLTRRVDGTPLIKILDFGIAKAPSDNQFQLTRTATVMGSPGYMSPEQLRSSRDADPRSDIWALGTILYELIAGRRPFVAETITELTLRVAMDPMPPLPGVPRELEAVIARCLEKDPKRRFGDVRQLAAALAPAASNAEPTTIGSSASALPGGAAQRMWWPRGLIIGVAVIAAIATVSLVTRQGSDIPAGAPPRADYVVTPGVPTAVSPPAPMAADAGTSNVAVDSALAAGTVGSAEPPGVEAAAPPAVPAPVVKSSPSARPVAPMLPPATSVPPVVKAAQPPRPSRDKPSSGAVPPGTSTPTATKQPPTDIGESRE
jgi:serine/threonine-protein kinase